MPYASQLLFNAVILTLDAHDTVASAIALDGDRILAVGTLEDLSPFVGPDTIRRDMEGKTVITGYYDAHGVDAGLGRPQLPAHRHLPHA